MREITGERLLLREISEEDTEMVLGWRNSDAVRANFIYQTVITQEEHLNWLKNKIQTGRVIQFVIFEKESGRGIGSVYLRDIDYENRKAEYGIFIGEKDARGKGYGAETAKIIIRFAFEELELHKLSLRVLEKNQNALKSYENVGFRMEGRMIDDVRINGQYQTLIFMAIFSNIRKGDLKCV